MMTQEAILYYADHPADFVEDLLHVTPDKNQRAILDSVAMLFYRKHSIKFQQS